MLGKVAGTHKRHMCRGSKFSCCRRGRASQTCNRALEGRTRGASRDAESSKVCWHRRSAAVKSSCEANIKQQSDSIMLQCTLPEAMATARSWPWGILLRPSFSFFVPAQG